MIKDYFKIQIESYPRLTDEVLDRVDFKTVWSGKRMVSGDRVLYALVYVPNTDDLKAITFLERELDEISSRFNFVTFENEGLPILSFAEDTKKRN
jgi:hypothetical protein